MRAAFVFFALAAAAYAQDELYDTTWIVRDNGELFGWPDPDLGDRMQQTFKPFPVFKDGAPDLFASCPAPVVLLLACGPTDIASLCNVQAHLKKTNQLAFDENVCTWIQPSEEYSALDESSPLIRRALLDRLMLMRIAEVRGLKDAIGGVESVAKSEKVDRVTRMAAGEISAALRGEKPPSIGLPALRGIPTDADVLVVVDERRLPRWRDAWRLHHTESVRQARQVIIRVGVAVTPRDLCEGQWAMDREGELFYELARRFGNARVHRIVLALRIPEGADDLSGVPFLLRGEGIFDPGRFKEGCAAGGVKTHEAPEGAVSGRFADVDVTMSPDRLVASRDYPPEAPGSAIPADLAKLGLGGDDAIWIHCRKMPFAGGVVEGIESLTIRANFDGGVTVEATGRFRDEESAHNAANAIVLKALDLEPVALREANPAAVARLKAFLESAKVSVDGATVVARWSGPKETPESLLEGVVDLAALYDR